MWTSVTVEQRQLGKSRHRSPTWIFKGIPPASDDARDFWSYNDKDDDLYITISPFIHKKRTPNELTTNQPKPPNVTQGRWFRSLLPSMIPHPKPKLVETKRMTMIAEIDHHDVKTTNMYLLMKCFKKKFRIVKSLTLEARGIACSRLVPTVW